MAGLGVHHPLELVLPSANSAQLQEEVVRTLVTVVLQNLTYVLKLIQLYIKLTIRKLSQLYGYFEKDCSISPLHFIDILIEIVKAVFSKSTVQSGA